MSDCNRFQVLQITDGTTTVDFLNEHSGFFVTDWSQMTAPVKNDGVWADSPLVDGRKLKMRKRQNVIQTWEIQARDWNPDVLIRDTRNLRQLLNKAAAYSTTGWQRDPVWIKRQGLLEENPTYTLIEDYRAEADGYPFSHQDLFWNALGQSAMPDWSLAIEHEPFWRSVPPGQPCPEEKSESISYCFPSHLTFDGADSLVNCGSDASLDDIPDNAVAGRGQITAEAWIKADGYGEANAGIIFRKLSVFMRMSNTAGLYAEIRCAAQNAVSTSGLDEFTADGLWHHILMTYDETGADLPAARTIYLAIDGVWVASYPTQQVSIGNYVTDAAANLIIGNDAAATTTFDGDIGWVRVSDSIRYDPAGGDFTPEPRCELPTIDADVVLQVIYEGYGATTYDRSGNDNDGTISDAVWDCDCTYTEIKDVECNCVQTTASQDFWMYQAWSQNTAQPVGIVRDIIELSVTYPGRLVALDVNAPKSWYTDDGGATNWTQAVAQPANTGYGIIEDPSGDLLWAGTAPAGIYRSTDGGLNWALRNNVRGASTNNCLVVGKSGYVYLVDAIVDRVYRSNDIGLTWDQVFSGPTSLSCIEYCSADGYLYVGGRSTTNLLSIYRSQTGDAGTFEKVFEVYIATQTWSTIRAIGDTIYALTSNGRVYKSTNGEDWSWINPSSLLGGNPFDLVLWGDGLLYAVSQTTSSIYRSKDGEAWEQYFASGTLMTTLKIWSITGRLYVGKNGDIWFSGPLVEDVGSETTCLDDVFIENKKNVAQLTDALIYDASTGLYEQRYPQTNFDLFPVVAAVGDTLFIGIRQTIDSGPFCNVVFDLDEVFDAQTWTITWRYSDGNPWGTPWTALNVHDETISFGYRGINMVNFTPPSDWVAQAVNGITAFWIAAEITALAVFIDGPIQQHRPLYTINWPDVDIDDAQVGGDIEALLRIKAHNRSDEDGYESTVDELDLMTNRLIVGLRSDLRGDQFTSFINLAEDGIVANTYSQNPTGITVEDGTGTTTGADNRAPSGIACVHTTTGNGLTTYDDAAIVKFVPATAKDYYGEFHVFLRAQLEDNATTPVGDNDDVRVRLRYRTGSGGVERTTGFKKFIGWDANGEHYKDFQLLDFGRVVLPVSGQFDSDELPDEFTITVQIASAATTNLDVTLYDLNLMPVDEWSGDFVDAAFEDDSGVTNGYLLDADSVTYPKQSLRSTVRTADASAFIRSVYERRGLGPAILQANADQRLFFLSALGVVKGDHTGANNAAILTDSYADFVDAGVKPGMIVYNVTDGSSAEITAVTVTTITGTLAGGAEDDWDTGDEYFIVCPNWRSDPSVVHSIQLEHVARYESMRGAD